MGNLKIDQVFNRILTLIGDIPLDSKSMVGTVHTLKTMIVKSTEANEEMTRRLTSTLESSTNHSFGDKLLQFLAKYAPNEIATIGLNSMIFREAMSNKMCETILQTKGNDQL